MMRPSVRSLLATGVLLAVLAVIIPAVIVPAVSARGNVGAPVRVGNVDHTIAVVGHGEATATPDEATLTLGVQSKGNDAQSALADNSTRMNAVIAAVQGQGVPASHIQTSNLSIWYDSEHNTYVVSHEVTVRLDNVQRVGAVLDAAVAAGVNNSWGVSFGLKDSSGERGKALQTAVADARKRAESMATALGVTVSGVGSASEANVRVQPPPYASAAAPSGAPSQTQVQPGELTITADVNVIYTFG